MLSHLKKGDKVILHATVDTVQIVENITPKGFIRVLDEFYHPDGKPRYNSYSGLHLSEYTFEKELQIETIRMQKETIQKAFRMMKSVERLNYDNATKIISLLTEIQEQSHDTK